MKPRKPRKRKAKPVNRATETLQEAFLAAYAGTGQVQAAAEAAGCPRSSHYQWMHDPAYAARFKAAREELADSLEAEAMRRVLETRGEAGVGSDGLLIALLKALKRQIYGDHLMHDGEVTVTVRRIELDQPSIHE